MLAPSSPPAQQAALLLSVGDATTRQHVPAGLPAGDATQSVLPAPPFDTCTTGNAAPRP
jgi:hypothetical protein